MTECLHCEINEVVRKHLEENDQVNVVELVAKMSESIVDLILLAPEDQQAKLMAEAIRHLGYVFLQESGALDEESQATH